MTTRHWVRLGVTEPVSDALLERWEAEAAGGACFSHSESKQAVAEIRRLRTLVEDVRADRDRLRDDRNAMVATLRSITTRGGPGHWSWRIVDAALGPGVSAAWHAADKPKPEDDAPTCQVCREYPANRELTRRAYVCGLKCFREWVEDDAYEQWKARRKP